MAKQPQLPTDPVRLANFLRSEKALKARALPEGSEERLALEEEVAEHQKVVDAAKPKARAEGARGAPAPAPSDDDEGATS